MQSSYMVKHQAYNLFMYIPIKKSHQDLVRLTALANFVRPDAGLADPVYVRRLRALARQAFTGIAAPAQSIPSAEVTALTSGDPPDWVAERAALVARDILNSFADGADRVEFPAAFAPMLTLDAAGLIRPVSDIADMVTSILAGKSAARIRRCPVCSQVFIALRRDQSACAGKCTGAYNTRRWRERQRQYEQNRRRNRVAKAARAARRAKEEGK